MTLYSGIPRLFSSTSSHLKRECVQWASFHPSSLPISCLKTDSYLAERDLYAISIIYSGLSPICSASGMVSLASHFFSFSVCRFPRLLPVQTFSVRFFSFQNNRFLLFLNDRVPYPYQIVGRNSVMSNFRLLNTLRFTLDITTYCFIRQTS